MKHFFAILLLSFCLLALPGLALAKDEIRFEPQVTIPGSQFVTGTDIAVSQSTQTICEYIAAIYKYMIGVIGIFAAMTLIIGGVIWITAAGRPAQISLAKDWIAGSLMGLALALGAYLILATINFQLTICTHLEIPALQKIMLKQNNFKNCYWSTKYDCKDSSYTKEKDKNCEGPRPKTSVVPGVSTDMAWCCCQKNSATSH